MENNFEGKFIVTGIYRGKKETINYFRFWCEAYDAMKTASDVDSCVLSIIHRIDDDGTVKVVDYIRGC